MAIGKNSRLGEIYSTAVVDHRSGKRRMCSAHRANYVCMFGTAQRARKWHRSALSSGYLDLVMVVCLVSV